MPSTTRRGEQPLILVASSGTFKREVFELAEQLGYKTLALEDESHKDQEFEDKHWVVKLRLYKSDSLLETAVDKLKSAGVNNPAGICTLWELAVEPTAILASRYKVTGITQEAALLARDKFRMRQSLANRVRQVDRFELVNSVEEAKDFFRSVQCKPIMLKPRDLGASTGILSIEDEEEIADAWCQSWDAIHNFGNCYDYRTGYSSLLAEEMIPKGGREVNVDLFVNEGVPHVLGIAEKADLMDGKTFREDAYVFPPFSLSGAELNDLAMEAKRAVQALGIAFGAVHLEAKMVGSEGSRQSYVIELGARCAGDVEMPALKLHCGVDLRELVLRQAMGDLRNSDLKAAQVCDQNAGRGQAVAAQVIYADRPLTLTHDLQLEPAYREKYRVVKEVYAAKAGYKVELPENDYLGALIALGDDSTQAVDNVRRAVKSVRVD